MADQLPLAMQPDAERLHRIHAAPSEKGNRVDVGAVAWRGEGGDFNEKRAQARRIAVTWNVCEGWPTEALEAGALRCVDDAAWALLLAAEAAIARIPDQVPVELELAAVRLRAAFVGRDAQQDLTHGRPHDCPSCLPREGADDPDANEGARDV